MRKIYQNYDWKFKENYEEADLALGNYEGFISVNIPHTNKEVPLSNFDSTISNFVSIYKKELELDLTKTNELVFEGIGHRATIYVNGKLAAISKCGYTRVSVLLNEYAIDKRVEVSVVCDSREIDQPPFGFVIDYLCFGGMYRDVYLNRYCGTYVKDYYFHHDYDNYYLDYELSSDDDCDVTISFTDGNTTFSKTVKNKEKLFDKLPNVTLWDVDNPYLYDIEIKVSSGNHVYDKVYDRVGFRYAEFKENGFFLNGKHVKLRGLNRHQSYPYVGYAMPKSMQYDDAKLLKNDLKVNAVRTSHYPQSPDFLRACDELGLLVFEEIPGWQNVGDLAWQEIAINNVAGMINRDKNHPSIILWGVRINESGDYHDFYTKTNALAHKLDPYRSTGGVRCSLHSELLEDVYTYNDFINTLKGIELREKSEVTTSNKPYLVSEYGGHMFPTKSFDSEIRRTDVALIHTGVLRHAYNDDLIAGSFGWCFADYNTHMDFGSGDLICYHGVMDIFRNPKYSSYPYKACGNDDFLEVTSNFNIGEHNGGYIRSFSIMSNMDKIEMYHNDVLVNTYDNLNTYLGGCFKVDDLIGNILINLEGLSKDRSDYIKEIIQELLRWDLIVRKEITNKYPADDIEAARCYYGKYVSNWGSHPTPYTFKGYKNNKLVKTLVRGPQSLDHIEYSVNNEVLHTKNSYDVCKITLEAIGTLGARCDYAFDAFKVSTTKGLEVIGDEYVSLIGGVRGIYVKSLIKEGTEYVTIESRFGMKIIKLELVED